MGVSWLLIKKTSQRSIGRLGLMVSAIGLGTVILLSFISGINVLPILDSMRVKLPKRLKSQSMELLRLGLVLTHL